MYSCFKQSLVLVFVGLCSLGACAADAVVTNLTSFHSSEFAGNDENGIPKGWPSAASPLAPPLLTKGVTGEYLLTPMANGLLSRAPKAPGHYQVENVLVALQLENFSVPVFRADGTSFTVRSLPRLIGNYVQRNNGDVIGLLAPPRALAQPANPSNINQAQFTLNLADGSPVARGALYRLDWDGTFPSLLSNSIGALHFPLGFLLHDPETDAVYGIDEGPEGNGRVFRLNADNQVEILYSFPRNSQGLPQVPNGLTLGADGYLYGLLGYDRGTAYHPATLVAPTTNVGALYRLHPDNPSSTFAILHSFTLAQGEINAVNPSRYSWMEGGTVPALSHLIEGPDGWLYGGLSVGQCDVWFQNSYWEDARAMSSQLCWWTLRSTDNLRYFIYQKTPGVIVPPYALNPYPDFPNGVSNWPYMPPPFNDSPKPFGALYRLHKDSGAFQILHNFTQADGASPRGPMAVGNDGAIYGTALSGGKADLFKKVNGQPAKVLNGTIYRIDPAAIQAGSDNQVSQSGVEIFHHFVLKQDGAVPLGLTRAHDDRLYGATLFGGRGYTAINLREYDYGDDGTLFSVDTLGSGPGGTVLLTATPTQSRLGEKVELTWTSSEVTHCEASSSLAQWKGAIELSGSIDLQLDAGTHYLSIACRDVATGLILTSSTNVRVDVVPEIESDVKTSYGNGGGATTATTIILLLLLGAAQFTYRREIFFLPKNKLR